MEKIILDLYGGTGAWSKFYKDRYEVKVITLPKWNVYNYYFHNGFIVFYNNGNKLRIRINEIYGILAAPICTMFSLARTRAKTPRDFKEGMKGVITTLGIIWGIRHRHKLKFWCIENPMGYLRQFLGKPVFTFDPCDFGDPYTKKTDLWGYFNIPKKCPIKLTKKQKQRCKINARKLPSISDFTGSKQVARRAITPNGFAQAFFEANR